MSAGGTWLCPTQLHRERLLEMERRITRARAIMYGSLAIAFVIGIPWIGIWTLIPLGLSIVTYGMLRPRIATSERPEYVVAATVVNAQVLIGIGIALSGGPASPDDSDAAAADRHAPGPLLAARRLRRARPHGPGAARHHGRDRP